MFISPVRCTGSKRRVAKELSKLFPESYDIVYEPFIGGGNLLPYYKQDAKIYASDINEHYIHWWNYFKDDNETESLLMFYQNCINSNNLKEHYYELRKLYNMTKSSIILFVLSYMSINNLIRFNKAGEFNAAFDLSLQFTKIDKLKEYINNFKPYMENVSFKNCSYLDIKNDILLASEHSEVFCFFDPPHEGKKYKNLYQANVYNKQDFESFLFDINKKNIKYMVTLADDELLPEHLYLRKTSTQEIRSGFGNISSKFKHSDSVYLNYL